MHCTPATGRQAFFPPFFESFSGLAHVFIGFAAIVFALTLAACSPIFNWREVPLNDSGAQALLPCKPDRAQRLVPLLPNQSHSLHMAGCKAGGAIFSVAVVALPGVVDERGVETALAVLSGAGLAAVNAKSGLRQAAQVKGADAAQMHVLRLESGPSTLVFARKTTAQGSVLMQAQVLGEPKGERDGPSALSAEAIDTFLTGLSL